MQVNQFLEKQTYLGITNSVLKNDTKVNESLLDYVYISLEGIKKETNSRNVICNVIVSEIPNSDTMKLKMSGSSYSNNSYCYDNLKHFFNTNKEKYPGTEIAKETDSYKIFIQSKNTTGSTTGSTSTKSTSKDGGTTSRSELERQMADLIYRPAKERYSDTETKESVEEIGNLLEEINRIKKIMLI